MSGPLPPRASDPSRVPIQSAATVMILADRPDLRVLLLRRRAKSVFVPGMVVFPGGAVDPADAEPEVEALCHGLDDQRASARLGLATGGLAYWVAAIRETFEEAGVLLAVREGEDGPIVGSDPARAERLAALRAEVDAGRVRLADVVRDEGLRLPLDVIHYAARWITPEGPPRRYDTRFFVAALPAGQRALHDEREAVHSEWVRPTEALARFEEGALAMLPPTCGMLRVLAGFERAESAIAAAARQEDGPDVPAKLASEGEHWRVLLPGDAGYESAGAHPLRAWLRFLSPAMARAAA